MASFNIKIVKAKKGSPYSIGPLGLGGIVLNEIVDVNSGVSSFLFIPRTAFESLGVVIIPTSDVESEESVANFDISGSFTIST